ncbi:MAG TPA: hypothetical protein DC009_04195 [Porphyromonadaceae bacterium]|nr:hypothetical protein [Porphyromonadaceae bacterium]
MRHKYIIVLLTIIFCIGSAIGKDITIAGWTVLAMGKDHNNLTKISGEAIATITIHNGQVFFSLWDTESHQSLGPSILIERLYLDQSAAENNSFIGMKSKVRTLDGFNNTGILFLSMTKKDEYADIIHFDFGDNELYILGILIREDMFSDLSKLAALGIGPGKLKKPLEDFFQ